MNSLTKLSGDATKTIITPADTLIPGIKSIRIPSISCQRLRCIFSRSSGYSFAKLIEHFIALYLWVWRNIATRNSKRDGMKNAK